MVQQINLQTKISTEFLELLGNQMLYLEKRELLDESKDIWENIQLPKEERQDSDPDSDLDRDADGSFKERIKTQPGNPDEEVMLFERKVDEILRSRPGRK